MSTDGLSGPCKESKQLCPLNRLRSTCAGLDVVKEGRCLHNERNKKSDPCTFILYPVNAKQKKSSRHLTRMCVSIVTFCLSIVSWEDPARGRRCLLENPAGFLKKSTLCFQRPSDTLLWLASIKNVFHF